MKPIRILLFCLLLLYMVSFSGCKKQVDESVIIVDDLQEDGSIVTLPEVTDQDISNDILYEPDNRPSVLSGELGQSMADDIRVIMPYDNGIHADEWVKTTIETEDGLSDYYLSSGFTLEKGKLYEINLPSTDTSMEVQVSLISGAYDIYDRRKATLWESEIFYEFFMIQNTDTTCQLEVIVSPKEKGIIDIQEANITRKTGDLIFADEFDYEGLPDALRWQYDVGGHGWENGELQYYTKERPENAYVDEGSLKIIALKEDYQTNAYTSARLITKDIFDLTYGRVEFRAILPEGIGTCSALWMMPSDLVYGSGPISGEIDVMEHVGFDENVIHGTVHTGDYNHMMGTHQYSIIDVEDATTSFHTYAVEWTPVKIEYFVDDILYFTFKNDGIGTREWPFDQDFYMIMCLTIGGSWGGQQGIDDDIFPQTMTIDYVRVYELPLEIQDIQPPDQVFNAHFHGYGSMIDLTWDRAYDDYIVKGYNIYLNDDFIGFTSELSYQIYNLPENKKYIVGVETIDTSDNASTINYFQVETGTFDSAGRYLEDRLFIEAEDYTSNVGVEFKSMADSINQYADMIDPGDRLTYEIDVQSSGYYCVNYHVSSKLVASSVSTSVDGNVVVDTTDIAVTGDWNNYLPTKSDSFYMSAGKHTLDVIFKEDNCRFDAMDILMQ